MAEEKRFIDEAGLAAFWESVETALTRMYQHVPEGQQIARVYQRNGRLHVEVEDFGGTGDRAKKAARASLGVGVYKGYAAVSEINSRTLAGEFIHGDIITASDGGTLLNGSPVDSIRVNAGDSVIRCVFEESGGNVVQFWQKLGYKPSVNNVTDPETHGDAGVSVATSITQDAHDGTINVANRKVGLYCEGNCLKFG